MAQKKATPTKRSDKEPLLSRFDRLVENASAYLPSSDIYSAFMRAGQGLENMPMIQNRRIKSISPLPQDVTKEDIGAALQAPYASEELLGRVSTALKYAAYPYFKIIKTYADIPTYRNYAYPLYLDASDAKSEVFKRETVLVDKIVKAFQVEKTAHKIAGQAVTYGKVFYIPRYSLDKSHSKVNYAFMQQLPQAWTTIIGNNSVSGYTVSFNMMYFLQPGTNPYSFGDLFEPYISDFERIFRRPKGLEGKAVYSSANVRCGKQDVPIFPCNLNAEGEGRPRLFMQNGTWMYWVSLPIEKVWTFEIDDTSPAVVSPLAGLMLTYAQQSDYENAQLSLLLNPLVKIFTGEIPYYKDEGTTEDSGYRLGAGARAMFEALFDNLMATHNTGGTALYMAPLENIKSHDFAESANANEISTSFNRYGLEKAGLSGILPSTSDPKAGLAEMSAKLESRYAERIYRQFENMMNFIFESENLHYEWRFAMFGSIYTDEKVREAAYKALANGDTSAHFILAALDGQSFADKLCLAHTVKESGLLDLLIPPITSYTMKQSENGGLPPQNGRPSASAEGATEGTEKTIDTRGSVD